MESIKMRRSASSTKHVNNGRPCNDTRPLRVAVIGGKRAGKTSLIANAQWGGHNDTYYPTTLVHPTLFEFTPKTKLARAAFDEISTGALTTTMAESAMSGTVARLSPAVEAAVLKNKTNTMAATALKLRRSSSTKSTRSGSGSGPGADAPLGEIEYLVHTKNNYYATYNTKQELQEYALQPLSTQTGANSSLGWPLPQVSPVLVELIDTPAFNPDHVVPFLEVSLHKRLTKAELHNLANEPAKPVLANPLLVASGASEMNGNIDGYFFVYSPIPSESPPSYNEGTNSGNTLGSTGTNSVSATGSAHLDGVLTPLSTNSSGEVSGSADTSVGLLPIIREALIQAWEEYYSYTTNWSQGQEADIYLFKQAMKNMWKLGSNTEPTATALVQNKSSVNGVSVLDMPNSASGLPPIWIVCTHIDSPLKAPVLVEEGMRLAKEWGCGFVTVDTNREVDYCLALMIRDIAERNRLNKKKK